MQEFVDAVRADDALRCANSLAGLECTGALGPAFRAIAGLSASDDFRQRWLRIFKRYGDLLRSNIDHDLSLIDGLRVLLPSYSGPARTVYRGDGVPNRRRRTYGPSWTTDANVARGFAEIAARNYIEGGVLLEAFAPAAAIICEPAIFTELFDDEQELIVDRRKLREVKVLERFPVTTAKLVR